MSKTAMKKAAKAARLEKLNSLAAEKPNGEITANAVSSSDSAEAGSFTENLGDLEPEPPVDLVDEATVVSNHALEPPVTIPLEAAPPSKDPMELSYSMPTPEPGPSSELEASPIAPIEAPSSKQDAPPSDPENVKKRQNIFTRTLWTFIMIGIFIGASPRSMSWFHIVTHFQASYLWAMHTWSCLSCYVKHLYIAKSLLYSSWRNLINGTKSKARTLGARR